MRINTNQSSMIAIESATLNTKKLSTSLEKLSTG